MTDHADTIRRDPTYDELAAKCGKLLAERKQAIDERETWQARSGQWHARYSASLSELDEHRARCEQAIDALREISGMCKESAGGRVEYGSLLQAARAARAALLNLGEQP